MNTVGSLLKKKEDLLPELMKNYENRVKEEKELKQKYDGSEKELNDFQNRLNECNTEQLGKDYHSLTRREKLLSDIMTDIEKINGERTALNVETATLKTFRKEIDESVQKLKDLESPLADAKTKVEECGEIYSRLEISMKDMVKDLRLSLKKGDVCPVCGSIVEETLSDNKFALILEPAREAKLRAEKQYVSLKSDYDALKKIKSDTGAKIRDLEKKIETRERNIAKKRTSLDVLTRDAGLVEEEPEGKTLEEISEKCSAERISVSEKMFEIRNKQIYADSILKEISSMQKGLSELRQKFTEAKDSSVKARSALSLQNSEIKIYQDNKTKLKEKLDIFMALNPDIDRKRLDSLSLLDGKEMQNRKKRMMDFLRNIRETA